ncbi:MAG: T9SS type A sorting domain-containing protein [Saprospiraceae bacterium]|nr:T9SS type A sorting domain-containing protein [Saprospiraceae bacterium]
MLKNCLLHSILFLFIIKIDAQTIQFQFCGKTESIATLDGGGKDQRAKSAIKLDFLKIGVRGASQTNPFYVMGNTESTKTNENFGDKILADNCSGSSGVSGTCNQCGICTNAVSTTNFNIGNAIGKFLNNVKVESKGNDMYIMCTGSANVICFETHRISLAGQLNKKLDVYYKCEGISDLNPSDVRNISLNYRFNNEAYFATPYFFNKNSGNVGVIEDVGSIQASVPVVATEDLSKKLTFDIAPNPVNDILKINLNVLQEFNGFINILSETGAIAHFEETQFNPSVKVKELNLQYLHPGNYILHISDEDARISIKKFIKI